MANTAFTAFTIGKDMALSINLQNVLGAAAPAPAGKPPAGPKLDVSDIGYLMNFKATPNHNRIAIKPISHGGEQRARDRFENFTGSFGIVRTGPITDLLCQILQDALLAPSGGAVYVDLFQTIYDPMGNGSGAMEFQFPNATLSPTNAGEFAADNPVDYAFEFWAPKRILLDAGNASQPTTAYNALQALYGALTAIS